MTTRADETPRLCAGDRLTRDEFERRYRAMGLPRKAELIAGVVHVPSPVSHARHGAPHSLLCYWLRHYVAGTPGTGCGDSSTVRLDLDNEPQPDLLLRVQAGCGGQTRLSTEGYVEGAPELVAEIAASSASHDLHDKLHAYRRNGVQEYLVWRVEDRAVEWFALRGGR
jgi:Uma2 family endonuclease